MIINISTSSNTTNKLIKIYTMKLTKEQHEKLKPYEQHLKSAYRNSYVHMPGTEFVKVGEIYTEIFGVALTKSQMGCNTCRLNALRKLGELYANYTEETPEEEKKESKRGRPKKLVKEDEE